MNPELVIPALCKAGHVFLRGKSFKTRLRVSRTLVNAIFLVKRRERRVRENIHLLRPDLSEKETGNSAKYVIDTMAYSWASLMGNGYEDPDMAYRNMDVEGIEKLLERHRRGERIILTFDHVGPIDEALKVLTKYELRTYTPVERLQSGWLMDFMNSCRMRMGEKNIFEPLGSYGARKQIKKRLDDGFIVIIAVDMISREARALDFSFGDTSLNFSAGAIRIALEERALLIPAFPSWDGARDNHASGGRRRVRIVFGDPFPFVREEDKKRSVEHNARRFFETTYIPHIREHWASWTRLLWLELRRRED